MAQTVTPAEFRMHKVRKSFGATLALDGVDLAVSGGEVCALVGQNGAGKSTLMGILAGAIAPDEGTMSLDGLPYAPAGPLQGRQAGVAMIHQELSLAPHLSVMDNIFLGAEPTRLGPCRIVRRDLVRQTAASALAQLGHSEIAPETPAGELSPSGQQLVELARALVAGCRLLVLDEPTSSLTRADARMMFQLVARLRSQGLAIIYISHFLEEVMQISDRFVVLRDGRNAGEGVTTSSSPDEIARLMVGRPIADLYQRSARRVAAEPLLQIEGLEIRRGEIVGIAGLLGAGRTRLLRAVFGLEPVRRNAVKVGLWPAASSPHERWRQGMGMLSEDRSGEGLAMKLSVRDNITMTKLHGLGPRGFVVPSQQNSAARRWIDRLGIRAVSPEQPVAQLSGGNQQKVAFARLLHHDVDLLLLDEPTRGVDVSSKAAIYRIVEDLLAGSSPKAVVLVSSYFPELLAVCDRISVMSRGQLGPSRPVSDWTEHELMVAASGGRAAS
jgi:ribose transport system ATP-binding protein